MGISRMLSGSVLLLLALALPCAPPSRGDDPQEKSVEEQLREAKRRVVEVEGELQTVKLERDILQEKLRTATVRSDLLLKEVAELRQMVRDAMKDREEKAAKLVETTDKLLQAQAELARLREAMRASQPLTGMVLNAQGERSVEISIGSKDGVRKDMSFAVIRTVDGKPVPVAALRVVEVNAGTTVCTAGWLKDGGKVQKGDRVAEWKTPFADPPPGFPIRGLVLAVKGEDSALVQISLGSDDGVKRGDKLQVIRADGSMYLGQIEVLETQPDRSVCRIIKGTEQGAINKGDHVRTHLDDVLDRE